MKNIVEEGKHPLEQTGEGEGTKHSSVQSSPTCAATEEYLAHHLSPELWIEIRRIAREIFGYSGLRSQAQRVAYE